MVQLQKFGYFDANGKRKNKTGPASIKMANIFRIATAFSMNSRSMLMRYALPLHPPYPPLTLTVSRFALFVSSLSQLPSPRHVDEAVDSFTRMLSMRPTPSIIQFNKILGSLAKVNRFPTAISLFHQLQLTESLLTCLLSTS
ncbi:hypothetical protein PIB30_074146 [Stylosanthes scabra]|uniref:Pentatricopeptide repeat-containing protein n=1 Tax=Stylosanthes scabra TaxID=79078 RepID=A0ABU6QPZ2_9FABA|nr:hypothetical protein [Stylosanthes scabra]